MQSIDSRRNPALIIRNAFFIFSLFIEITYIYQLVSSICPIHSLLMRKAFIFELFY